MVVCGATTDILIVTAATTIVDPVSPSGVGGIQETRIPGGTSRTALRPLGAEATEM